MKSVGLRKRSPLGGTRRDADEKALIALAAFTGLTGVVGGALVIFEIGAIDFMPLQVVEGVVGQLILGLAARRWLAKVRPLRHALHWTAAEDLLAARS